MVEYKFSDTDRKKGHDLRMPGKLSLDLKKRRKSAQENNFDCNNSLIFTSFISYKFTERDSYKSLIHLEGYRAR